MIIDSKFQPVADTFFHLTSDQPYGGAALAIYQDGQPVIDVYAGEARPGVAWGENTRSVIFSTSKGILSVLCHTLVERGLLDVDEKVATYWPEFAAHGKTDITVAMIMRHRAGLSAPREDLTLEDLQKVVPVEEAFARQAPIWEPDSGYLYHAMSIGHLLGKIIFNITGKRVNEFLQEVISQPLGIHAWFGIPDSVEKDVTLLKSDGASFSTEQEVGSPLYWSERAMSYGKAFTGKVDDLVGGYNDPRVHALENAGAGGISDARSIAKMYSSLVTPTDGIRLLKEETIKAAISRPNQGLNIFNDPAPHAIHSLGFMVANPEHSPVLSNSSFGHDGLGGQKGLGDLEFNIGLGYVTNWIPMVGDGMARHREITRTLIKVLQK